MFLQQVNEYQLLRPFLMHARTTTFTPPLASLPDLGQLKKLETLTADHNSLSSLPDTLSQLKSLKSLHLSHNKLSTFPPHLCQLSHLLFADLSTNQIAEIPAENVEVLTVIELNLNNNRISVLSGSCCLSKTKGKGGLHFELPHSVIL